MYCEHFEESLWESCNFRRVMSEGQRKSLESPTRLELNIFQVPSWLSFASTFLRATERLKPGSWRANSFHMLQAFCLLLGSTLSRAYRLVINEGNGKFYSCQWRWTKSQVPYKIQTCDLPKTRSVGSCSILWDQQCEHNEWIVAATMTGAWLKTRERLRKCCVLHSTHITVMNVPKNKKGLNIAPSFEDVVLDLNQI